MEGENMEKITLNCFKHPDGVWRQYPPDYKKTTAEALVCVKCGFRTCFTDEVLIHECGEDFITEEEYRKVVKCLIP
jgi:hypothetical protein